MMGEEYLDNVSIEKFVVINDDMWNTKDSFIKINTSEKKILNRDFILNYSAIDLIEKANLSTLQSTTNSSVNENTSKLKILEENKEIKETDSIPPSKEKTLQDLLDEFNVFLENKISLLLEAKCVYSDEMANKIKSNNELFRGLYREINEKLNHLTYTTLQRLTENLIKILELINGYNDKEHDEEVSKKNTFLKRVIRQKLSFYSARLKSFEFPSSTLERVLYNYINSIEINAFNEVKNQYKLEGC